jgi:predicted transcriptional regulator
MSTRKHPKDLAALGRRERQIMDVVHRRGRVSVAEVLEDLEDPPTYSAVRGMLRLLEEKGYVRHRWDGPRYVYLPTTDPEQVRKSAVRHLLQTFFGDSVEVAVAAMLDVRETKLTDDELKRLRKLIDDARKERS